MNQPQADRRGTYFLFQGLLTAVLLLLFVYQYRGLEGWALRFYSLSFLLGASLAALKFAPADFFSLWWVQMGLFFFDACVISATLTWTHPQSNLFLLYILILFGAALTRDFTQSFVLGIVILLLYLVSGWTQDFRWPEDTEFWLKFNFLCIATFLMTLLSRDAQRAQQEQERQYLERAVQIERLATLGQIAGEVAHQIKGPLTTILVNTEILSFQRNQSKKALGQIAQIQAAVRHCQEILKDLLNLGRIEEIAFAPLDLREPVESALKSLASQVHQKSIHLEISGLDAPKTVLGETSLLHEAIVAVLQNAVDSTRAGGNIALRLDAHQGHWWDWRRWRKPAVSGPYYAVTIEDNGKGIDAKDLERIFQPFFSTKGAQGSGLGLSAALRILQKHHGTIEAFSPGPGQGARFTLIFPAFNGRDPRSGKAGRSGGKSKSRWRPR